MLAQSRCTETRVLLRYNNRPTGTAAHKHRYEALYAEEIREQAWESHLSEFERERAKRVRQPRSGVQDGTSAGGVGE